MEKMKTNVAPEAEASSQQPSAQNHLPQSPLDTPASAQTASSSSPAAPAAQTAPSPPAKLHIGRDTHQKWTCCSKKSAIVCSLGRLQRKVGGLVFVFCKCVCSSDVLQALTQEGWYRVRRRGGWECTIWFRRRKPKCLNRERCWKCLRNSSSRPVVHRSVLLTFI